MNSPEAVNISNVAALVDTEGKPHFKYIVEGANLFLTQQARLFLEKRKVVLFKDSSANKGSSRSPIPVWTFFLSEAYIVRRYCLSGGVTSSSLEVLAGLALSTDEYLDHMIFKNGQPSPFYKSYVSDVQQKITENAAAEFTCIWREHQRCGGSKPRTLISDELSSTLNNLQAELEGSDLFEDVPSRKGVIRRAIPKTLVEKVGLEVLLERLPETYQRALFSSWVASHFVSYCPSFRGRWSADDTTSACRFTSTVCKARASTSSISRGASRTRRLRGRSWMAEGACGVL